MQIAVKQINQSQLTSFVATASSGSAFSGNLAAYYNSSGTFGSNVLYTYSDQFITGTKTFFLSPVVPYSGGTGTASSAGWVLDKLSTASGFNEQTFVHRLGAEVISGAKVFDSPLTVNSPTATGHAVNLGYLTGASGILATQGSSSSGALAAQILATSGVLNGSIIASGALLSAVKITGSSIIQVANFTGLGGTLVIWSGNQIFISGAAGGAGSSNTSVTGSAAISAPNFTGVGNVIVSYNGTYVLVSGASSSATSVTGSTSISSPNFTGVGNVTLTYNGTYVIVSGTAGLNSSYSGFADATFVHLTGAETISGIKTFVLSPLVPNATTTGQAVNFGQLSGVSGALVAAQSVTNNYWITGTGVVTASFNASGNINNTFSITSGNINVINSGTSTNTFNNSGTTSVISSGTVSNTFNGTVNNVTNLSGITGNFVNMSFWFDQYSLGTGLNVIESFVARDFTFTGYALGAINSGTQGFFSGSFYQRTSTNTKTNFVDFSLNSGQLFVAAGGYNQTVSGLNRVGLDIYRIGTGITGLSVGLFGVGY